MMDEVYIKDDVSPKECCLGNNTVFTYHEATGREGSQGRREQSFINRHTQEAINELGPSSPNWFEEALHVSNSDKGYITPIQSSKQSFDSFGTSPQLFSPGESDGKVNRGVLLQTPISLDDFDPDSPGIFTTPCQARRLPMSRKYRPSGFTSDTPLGTESPSALLDTADRGRHSTPTSFAHLAKSLGMDPNASQLSWTSSLATPPRSTAKFTSSEDEETSADEQFKFGMGPARALFSPQTPHSDETDTDMESLNFTMDAVSHESPGGPQKPAKEESQGTEPFSVSCPPSQELLGRDEQSMNSSGGMEFSCRQPDPGNVDMFLTESIKGSSSSEGVGARTNNSDTFDQQESKVFGANVISETGLKPDCAITDHIEKESELFAAVVVSETGVISDISAELKTNQISEKLLETDLKRDSSNVSGNATLQPAADTPSSEDVLSLLFKSPPGGSARRLPPKKKTRLSTAEIEARIPKTHHGDVDDLGQTSPLKNSISTPKDSISTPESSISLPFSERYSTISQDPVAMNTEFTDFASQGTLSILEEKTAPVSTNSSHRKSLSENGVSKVSSAPNTNPSPRVSGIEMQAGCLADGTTDMSEDIKSKPISLCITPKMCTTSARILDTSILSPCDEFSQISPSTLQAVCALEKEYEARSVGATSALISDNSLKTVSDTEGFKTPNLGTTNVSTANRSDICSPDGALFSQISPSTLEAIMNETDAVSEQHSKTVCDHQTLNTGPNHGGGFAKDVIIGGKRVDGVSPRKLPLSVEGQVRINDGLTVNSNSTLGGVLDAKTKDSLCVTPVRWRNVQTSAVGREADDKGHEGNDIKSKELDEKVSEFHTTFAQRKLTKTCANPPAPVSVTLPNASNNRSLLGRKRKRFSYPTSSQITETCPSKRFCFGAAGKSEETVAVENSDTHPVARVDQDVVDDDLSTEFIKGAVMPKTVDLTMSSGGESLDKSHSVDKSHNLDDSHNLDKCHNLDKGHNMNNLDKSHSLDRSLSGPSSVSRKVPQRRAGFTTFSSYQKTYPENQSPCKTVPKRFDENQNVCYTSPSYYRAGSKQSEGSSKPMALVGNDDKKRLQGSVKLEISDKARGFTSTKIDQAESDGFDDHSTLGGKLEVSDKAAKILVDLDEKNHKVDERNISRPADLKLKGSLCSPGVRVESPDKQGLADFGGFSTAGGKELKASSSALKWASKVLEEVERQVPGDESDVYNLRPETACVKHSNDGNFQGFSTCSGKPLIISGKSLKQAAKLFDEVDGLEVVDSKCSFGKPVLGLGRAGLSQGTDSKLTISPCAWEKAKSIFDDLDMDLKDDEMLMIGRTEEQNQRIDVELDKPKLENKIEGFLFASGKNVKISDQQLSNVKSMFDDIGEVDMESVISESKPAGKCPGTRNIERSDAKQEVERFSGFSFASGKDVKISNKLLNKAMNLFDDIPVEDSGSVQGVSMKFERQQMDVEWQTDEKQQTHEQQTDDKEQTGEKRQMNKKQQTYELSKGFSFASCKSDPKKPKVSQTNCGGNIVCEVVKAEDKLLHQEDDRCGEDVINGDQRSLMDQIVRDEGEDDLVAEEFEGNDGVDMAVDEFTDTQFMRHVDNTIDLDLALDHTDTQFVNRTMEDLTDTQFCAITETMDDYYGDNEDVPLVPSLKGDVLSEKAASIPADDFQSDFQTASGYAVSISKTTMQAYQESFESDSSIQNAGGKDEELDDFDYPVVSQDDSCGASPSKRGTGGIASMDNDCPRAEFGGFMPALGTRVNVSDKAVLLVRDKLADCNTETSFVGGGSTFASGNESHKVEFGGFTTAGGAKVNVSEEALQVARDKLADSNTDTSSVQGGSDITCGNESHKAEFGGFMTAGGTKVNVSEKALQLAKDKLADYNMETSFVGGGSTLTSGNESHKVEFGGFRTAGGAKVNVSEEALQVARDKLADSNTDTSSVQGGSNITSGNETHQVEFRGFKTAGGSTVKVSEKALLSARDKLADCDTDSLSLSSIAASGIDSNETGFGGFMTARGSKVKVSEKALESARNKLADCGTDNSLVAKTSHLTSGIENRFDGFRTASGSKVDVSEKALLSARDKLADCTTDCSLVPETCNSTTGIDSGGTGFGGFMTAGGSKVKVSEKALLSARDKLADCTGGDSLVPRPVSDVVTEFDGKAGFGGFMTAKGSKVDISEASLQKARDKLADCATLVPKVADDQGSVMDESRFCGFMTAKGSKVDISEASLQKAKDKLADCETEPETRDLCTLVETTNQAEGGTSGMRLHPVTPGLMPRRPVLVGATQSEQTGSKLSSADGAMDRKPSRFLMQVPKLTSHDPSVTGNATEFIGAGPAADALPGARDAVKSAPESCNSIKCLSSLELVARQETLHDRSHVAGRPRSSVVSVPYGDHKSGRWQQTSFKPHNLPTSKRPSSFITPTKNATASANKATPSPGPSSSFNTPYKKPPEGNFSTPMKATSEGSFTAPFKATPKGNLEEKTGAVSSPRPAPTCQVKRKSLDFSESPKHKESVLEMTQDISDTLMVEAATQDRNKCANSAFSCEVLESLTSAWQEERMGQDFAIQKKKKRKIGAISGSLFEKKASVKTRWKLRDAVQGGTPGTFLKHQLHQHGVCDNTLTVTAKTAEDFSFNILELYSEAILTQHPHLLLGDGARLVPNDSGKAGKVEFSSAFLAMPGVDPRLISDSWLHNQYRWVVWKLAAMEVAFPYHFGGRCLTPEQVMLRLKYRYDREVDHCQRSALKKIYERDDTPTKRMVLCVAGIVSLPENNPLGGQAVIELTDGWYSIKTLLDKPLTGLLRAGKISIGQKLCISGSELTGSQDACSPLEAPADLMLKIFANSTRRARWDSRLGFCDCPQPFPVPLSSLFPEGGLIGCVDVVVTRVYPTQFMEKLPDGSNVFRSSRMEEKIAKLHERKKEVAMETLQAKLQRQFDQEDKSERTKTSSRRMKRWKKHEVEALQTGYDIYEAMEQSSDPGVVQDYLSDHQMALLAEYRRGLMDERQARLRAEFQKALVENEEKASLTRQVVPLYKVRVAGTATSDMDRNISTFLTVWRPSEPTIQMLAEGKRLKIFNLSAAPSRGWQNKETSLTATRATQYQPVNAEENFIDLIYEPREVSCVGSMQHAPLYGELDIAGMVVSVPPETQRLKGFETVLTCDNAGNLATIKFWGGLQNYGVEEILKPGVFVGVCNLSWRRDSMSGPIRCVYVSESTHFTTKPHEEHLRTALEKLRRDIENTKTMIEEMKQKADDIVTSYADFSRTTPTTNRQLKASNLNTRQNSKVISENFGVNSSGSRLIHSNVTPSLNNMVSNTAARTDVLTLKSSKNESCREQSKLHSTREDCLSPTGEDSEDVRLSQQRSLQRSKAKKLEMYEGAGCSSPLPQVLQIATPVSNKLKRDFKAPTLTPVDSKTQTSASERKVDSVVKNLGSDFHQVSNDQDCDEGIRETSDCPFSTAVTPLVRTGLMTRARRIGLVSRRRSSVLPPSDLKVRHETDCAGKSDCSTTDSVEKTDSSDSNVCKSSVEMNIVDVPDHKPGVKSDDPNAGDGSDHKKAVSGDTVSVNSSKDGQNKTVPKSVGSGDCCEILTEKTEEIAGGAVQNLSEMESISLPVSKVSDLGSQDSIGDLDTPGGEVDDIARVSASSNRTKNKRKHSDSSSSDITKRRRSSRLSRRR